VPLEPDVVLSNLDVQLHTPTPAAVEEALWEAHMPSNVWELEAQSTLICNCVGRHKSLLPASIIEVIGQLKKGAEVMMLSAKLIRNWITSLERANNTATKRRQRKKKRIQKQGILTKGEGEDILAQKEADQLSRHQLGVLWVTYPYSHLGLVPLHCAHNFPLPLLSLIFTQQLLFYMQPIVVP
jgi:hypothetical protein